MGRRTGRAKSLLRRQAKSPDRRRLPRAIKPSTNRCRLTAIRNDHDLLERGQAPSHQASWVQRSFRHATCPAWRKQTRPEAQTPDVLQVRYRGLTPRILRTSTTTMQTGCDGI